MLTLGCLAAPLAADIIILKDGRQLEGRLRSTDGGWNVELADGTTVFVESARVESIRVTPGNRGAGPDEVARSRLESLRRSVETLDSPQQAIDRYEQFLRQYPATPVLEDAKKDLATWIERRDRKLVRAGTQWVPAEQRDAVLLERTRAALEGRLLLKAGQTRDAEQLLRKLLADDATNYSAAYLLGVAQFRAGQLPAARRSFEQVLQQQPTHPPTLNNLAVVLWQQRQHGPALARYDEALANTASQRELLDNVAEALQAAPADVLRGTAGQRLARKFADQDKRLQDEQATRGLFRWGSQWVDRAELDRLREIERRSNERIAALQSDFDLTQARIKRIDTDIQANEDAMREMENRSWTRTPDGRVFRMPLPPAYSDMQLEINRLRGERSELQLRIEALREAAEKARAEIPRPPFTGEQKLIGEDGVPVPSEIVEQLFPPPPPPATADPATAAPATAPATQPTDATPATQPADAALLPPTTAPATQPGVFFDRM
jgi:tetratricopeptide (TPR) repeat protein